MKKIAIIYGWRYQVLAQQILTDRRGPVFHFPLNSLGFVATEIGSPFWVPPHDVQDAALQNFGPNLPLELRQRLMELGWSEEDTFAGKSDWEQIPLTALPSLQYQQDGTGVGSGTIPSPIRPLMRRASSGSGHSVSSKRRKAVFAPILMACIAEQASLLARETDGSIAVVSRELVRLVQRDDSMAFLRPFTDNVGDYFAASLVRLNSTVFPATPSFAYSAMNALVGFLKTALRSNAAPASYSLALSSISLLVPHVSEISLRDIRKNKAEAVLLPASIHEEDGGFKLHTPWQENIIPVQTAQLLIITEILKANPREVYLVKKMLANLQIQASIHSLSFSRAWLVLIGSLFGTVSRNYNDRAELRHFLSNVAAILLMHGTNDILVTAHAMRVFTLCSAKFRRLFATMGFSTIMRSVYETYVHGDSAIRDSIEYALRSFYQIHQDNFVYQACLVMAEGDFDPASAYSLLASLSNGKIASSGVSSGIRGLNDKEEVDALVKMISGPEIAISDIGTAAAERQAQKLAAVGLDETVFPKENIIRLFATVIAANPALDRARSFSRLLSGILPYLQDSASQPLLCEAVEALGEVILKGRTGDAAAILAFHPGSDDTKSDWTGARREYVSLVESYARSGGTLSQAATRRTLEIVLGLSRHQPETVGPKASSILGQLAKTHLHRPNPGAFLRDIAPLFRTFIAVVDFSGVLDEITLFIKRLTYRLDPETTGVIINLYIEPAIEILANAAEHNMAYGVPLRTSAVGLLSAAVFLDGDAFGALERRPPNASLLASIVVPFCLILEQPPEMNEMVMYSALWVRLLRYIIRLECRDSRRSGLSFTSQAVAAAAVLSIQTIKVIVIRAPGSVSGVKGLRNYIAQHLLRTLEAGDGRFIDSGLPTQMVPRVVDWMMWSLFELLSLHRNPLQIDLRYRLRTALASLRRERIHSQPSTPGAGAKVASSPYLYGHARTPSVRSPNLSVHVRMPSHPSPEQASHSRIPSYSQTTRLTPEHPEHSRMPSQHVTPLLSGGHARMASGSSLRPCFTDLSARRASRPVFDVSPSRPAMAFRFPSSAPVRSGGGGAIVHLLGTPSQVLSATSSISPNLSPATGVSQEQAIKDIRISNEVLKAGTRRAVRVCQMVFGYELELEAGEEPVRVWSVHDALVSLLARGV